MMNPLPHTNPLAFHVMVKPIGPICNMDCRYCFYLEKDKLYRGNEQWRMSDEVLESFVRQYIEANEIPRIDFAWQGGEPTLLGIEFFRRVIELQQKYASGKQIENAIQTNGLLIDDAWSEFLAQNRFLVGLSIDGPAEIHDRYRRDKADRPTFDRVYQAMRTFHRHGVEFNTLTCVQRHNARHPLEVYRFLKAEGSHFMQFIPIVERIASTLPPDQPVLVSPAYEEETDVAAWSVKPLDYGNFLCAVFDEWVRQDVGSYYIQAFDIALEAWIGRNPSLCVYSRTCGQGLALEHNGDLYACDHYVYPENRLGNILHRPLQELILEEKQLRFGADKQDRLPRQCRECPVLFACNGECPKHRFRKTADGETGLNYLCPGLKHFFTHIDPCMQFMAGELREERPPANVMAWLRERRHGPTGAAGTGRNLPCPCGSGKKYKKCCGAVSP